MKAIVLAAGYATRLYPLTKEYPKPLLEIGEKPIVSYIVEKIEGIPEVNETIVVTNSKFFPHFQNWSTDFKTRKPLTIVDDLTKNLADRRGAVGDMHFVISKRNIQDDLLVIGGDNIFDGSLKDFISYAKNNQPHPVIGAYNLKHKEQASKYGVLKMDVTNRITGFDEKPKHPESALIAMCLYYFCKEKISLVEEYLKDRSEKHDKHDAVGFYIEWLIRKLPVYAYVFSGFWYDIGDHKCYNEAKEKFK